MPPVHVTPSESRDNVLQDSSPYEEEYKSLTAQENRLHRGWGNHKPNWPLARLWFIPRRNGGANGKDNRRVPRDVWTESNGEEEGGGDEDDEGADSDGDCVFPRPPRFVPILFLIRNRGSRRPPPLARDWWAALRQSIEYYAGLELTQSRGFNSRRP